MLKVYIFASARFSETEKKKVSKMGERITNPEIVIRFASDGIYGKNGEGNKEQNHYDTSYGPRGYTSKADDE